MHLTAASRELQDQENPAIFGKPGIPSCVFVSGREKDIDSGAMNTVKFNPFTGRLRLPTAAQPSPPQGTDSGPRTPLRGLAKVLKTVRQVIASPERERNLGPRIWRGVKTKAQFEPACTEDSVVAAQLQAQQLQKPMVAVSDQEHALGQRRFEELVAQMYPVTISAQGKTEITITQNGHQSAEGLAAAVQQVFQGQDTASLMDVLVKLPAAEGAQNAARPYLMAMRLADEARNVASGADHAARLIAHLADPSIQLTQNTLEAAELRAAAARLKRCLSTTATGMDALLHIERKNGWAPARKEGYQDALAICHWLDQQALRLAPEGAAGTVDDFLNMAHPAMEGNAHLSDPIGLLDDHPAKLAQKALRYAHALSRDDTGLAASALPDTDRHAYVAWVQGYKTSGADSAFQASMMDLIALKLSADDAKAHQHATRWVQRWVQIYRTVQGVLGKTDGLVEAFAAGCWKTATHQLLHEERRIFKDKLAGDVIHPLKEAIKRNIRCLSGALSLSTRMRARERTLQLAVLDLWQDKGIQGFRLDANELQGKFMARWADLGNLGYSLNEAQASEFLRMELGGRYLRQRNHRQLFKHLEKLAFDHLNPVHDLRQAPITEIEHMAQHAPDENSQEYARIMLNIAELQLQLQLGRSMAKDVLRVQTDQSIDAAFRGTGGSAAENLAPAPCVYTVAVGNTLGASAKGLVALLGYFFNPLLLLAAPDVGFKKLTSRVLESGVGAWGYKFVTGVGPTVRHQHVGFTAGVSTKALRVLSLGLYGYKNWSTQKTTTKGSLLTVVAPRTHPSYENTGARFTDFVRDLVNGRIVDGAGQVTSAALWGEFAQRWGERSDLSLSRVHEEVQARSSLKEMHGTATALMGVRGSALRETTQTQSFRLHLEDGSGSMKMDWGRVLFQTTRALTKSATAPHPFHLDTATVSVAGSPVGLGSVARQTTEIEPSAAIYLVSERGRLVTSLCYRDLLVSDASRFRAEIARNPGPWVAANPTMTVDIPRNLSGEELIDFLLRQRTASGQNSHLYPDFKVALLKALDHWERDLSIVDPSGQILTGIDAVNYFVGPMKDEQAADRAAPRPTGYQANREQMRNALKRYRDAHGGQELSLTIDHRQELAGAAAIDHFLDCADRVDDGKYVCFCRYTLTRKAADQIDLIEDRLASLSTREERAGRPEMPHDLRSELAGMEHARQNLLNDPESWEPRLFYRSRIDRSQDEKGLQWGIIAGRWSKIEVWQKEEKILKSPSPRP